MQVVRDSVIPDNWPNFFGSDPVLGLRATV